MEKLDGQSLDITQQRRQRLQELFPECFSEGELLVDKLCSLCGIAPTTSQDEHYEMVWQGKRACLPLALNSTKSTLRPIPEESLNFDTTHNLFIEGDNLEVLKILQRSYNRRVKVIYIDPPYNTGRDFVYKDNFKEPLKNYRELSSHYISNEAGLSGRFHTNYLNMMYPRLRLASSLLRDDGIMLISCDDGEMVNLRKLADEVFGEENFLGQFVWQTKRAARGVPPRTMVMSNHEYILAYARCLDNVRLNGMPRDESDFSNPDNDPRGLWRSESLRATGKQDNYFTITDPKTNRQFYGNWAFSQESIRSMLANDLIIFPSNETGTPRQKKFFNSYTNENKAITTYLGWHSTEKATSELMELFGGQKVFDFPKPQSLLTYLFQQTTQPGDIVLDFFAGSASTGEAILRLNTQDRGQRHFILVQLPEICSPTSVATKLGYKNICEIGRKRLRLIGDKLQELYPGSDLDCGFRLLRLDNSGFKHWDTTPAPKEELFDLYSRLHSFIDRIKADRREIEIVCELLLQIGYPLDSKLETQIINGTTIWEIENGAVFICLQPNLTLETVEHLSEHHPRLIITAEECFSDSSVLSNAAYILRKQGAELKLI